MGWYDANPVSLNPLAPSESAKKWVQYLGDVDEALRMAKADFEAGEYQWVAELTNTIVFADPDNTAARLLCADALEQLGYQAESGPWRNAYLTAALELRCGNVTAGANLARNSGSMVREMTADMLFDYMAILLDKQALASRSFTMNVSLTDTDERYMLRVRSGVLLVYEIIREAGLRLPKAVGGSVSIVAGLIIGDAAVSSGLISTPVLTVTAISVVSGFVLPDLNQPVTILRLVLILAGGFWGLFGISLVGAAVLFNICAGESFGIPAMAPIAPLRPHGMRDILTRVSFRKMQSGQFTVEEYHE